MTLLYKSSATIIIKVAEQFLKDLQFQLGMLLRRLGGKAVFRLGMRCLCDGNIETRIPHEVGLLGQCDDDLITTQMPKRMIKVAILGTPNAGKSTLINKLVGHPVLCVSKKVHTTRHRERAAVIRDNAQILFVDTPGLVTHAEVKK